MFYTVTQLYIIVTHFTYMAIMGQDKSRKSVSPTEDGVKYFLCMLFKYYVSYVPMLSNPLLLPRKSVKQQFAILHILTNIGNMIIRPEQYIEVC